jgi:hypothetical protein
MMWRMRSAATAALRSGISARHGIGSGSVGSPEAWRAIRSMLDSDTYRQYVSTR